MQASVQKVVKLPQKKDAAPEVTARPDDSASAGEETNEETETEAECQT